ncbi:MAG TPA: shikimate kinase [Actinomycetota bacterium]|nr:shikimate kinase [Actinomycetota bacterium]
MKIAPAGTVALIGPMGAGKSEVGALLARMSHRPFIDTDRAVEAAAGMSIAQIFQSRGEKEFRRIEEEVVKESALRKGAVIACGGGAVESASAMSALARSGAIVYLRIDATSAAARLGSGEGRPLLGGGEVEQKLTKLIQERSGRYEELADLTVDANGPPQQVAESITEGLAL